jgi:hypothetical protein
MAITFSQLFAPNQVNNAAVETLYTVPTTNATTIVRNMRVRFSNTSASACTIQAWAVPQSGSSSDSNCCLPETTLAAYNYMDLDIPVIAAGGTFRAQAGTATSITAVCIDGFVQS